ncbi:MAG: hypothetical protein JRF38_10570 [Deltaproteobacteria bacterium]|jgi:hypothetical protein|nr:hypothetical protein [Deltaproteobacteria bacterium]
MDNGCIEIGNIMTPASAEVIRKLTFILDQHAIFYVVDGVGFNQPPDRAAGMASIHPGRAGTAVRSQGNFFPKTCRLMVPDLYALNFMSLLCLDSDEADFLSTLIYGEHRES